MTSTEQGLTSRISAFQTERAGQIPAAAQEVFAGERAVQSARSAILPDLGTPMPDSDLLDAHGAPTTLSATRAGRAAVVVFYRGAWCPYCNITLRAYQELLLPDLRARDVALIALSPQTPDGALSAQETNSLSYDVLSDPGNGIAGALGICTATGEAALELTKQFGLDLPGSNADGTARIPMPTVVIVDAAGLIRWIDVHPDYYTRTEPVDILKRVAELGL